MGKTISNFVCQQCGATSPSFLGRCPNCGEWNSFVEETFNKTTKAKRSGALAANATKATKPVKLSEIKATQTNRIATGIGELDRVLGGGIVPGMAILVAGEPGIGKSTLLLQLANSIWHVARSKDSTSHEPQATSHVLYVAGEESASQIKIRADRLKIKTENLLILEETDADSVIDNISKIGPIGLIIIDSIQTLTTADLNSTAGSVGQVRECAARLIRMTKASGTPLFLVGHVTKEGAIAGPKVLEHIVDTVLGVEGDRYGGLRLIRTTKNRFGPTDEVGVFQMTDAGLVVVSPEELAQMTKASELPGSCLTITMEGSRPMLSEIQALVTSTPLPSPRRVASGVDYNRLLTIIAVLQKRLNIPLYREDIYVSVSGGLKIEEPAADLAIALAILTSYRNKPLQGNTVAIGELDLLGNVRRVNSLDRRTREARKLGFKNILTVDNLQNLPGFKL